MTKKKLQKSTVRGVIIASPHSLVGNDVLDALTDRSRWNVFNYSDTLLRVGASQMYSIAFDLSYTAVGANRNDIFQKLNQHFSGDDFLLIVPANGFTEVV